MHTFTPQVNRIKGRICQHNSSPPLETKHYSRFCKSVVGSSSDQEQPSQLRGRAAPDPRLLSGRKPSCLSATPPCTYGPRGLTSSFLEQKQATTSTPHLELFAILSYPALASSLRALVFPADKLPFHAAFSFLLFPFSPFDPAPRAPSPLSCLPPPPPFRAQSLSVPSSPALSLEGPPPPSQALGHWISSSSFSLVGEKAGQRNLHPPPLPPPLPSGTQKGTQAPDGLVLAEGLREVPPTEAPAGPSS